MKGPARCALAMGFLMLPAAALIDSPDFSCTLATPAPGQ